MISLRSRWIAFKLSLSCKLWDIRGLQSCPYHGFHNQSWWTGYCRECKEIPKIPPMEDMCIFCGEEKAVLQRPSPNGDHNLWSLCWECDKFIDWSEKQSLYLTISKDFPEFDEWLFQTEKVYPKYSYISFTLRKERKNE